MVAPPLWWPQWWRWSNWHWWSHRMSTSHQNLSIRPNIATVDRGQLPRPMKSLKSVWLNDLINTCKWSWAGVDRRMWRNGVMMAGNSEFIQISTSDPHTSSGLHGLFCFDVLTVTLVWCCIPSPLSTSLGTSHLLPTRSCPPQIYALRICTKTCGMPRWHT